MIASLTFDKIHSPQNAADDGRDVMFPCDHCLHGAQDRCRCSRQRILILHGTAAELDARRGCQNPGARSEADKVHK